MRARWLIVVAATGEVVASAWKRKPVLVRSARSLVVVTVRP